MIGGAIDLTGAGSRATKERTNVGETTITDQHLSAFERDGYFILSESLDAATLSAMREEADLAVDYQQARMDSGERVDTINIQGQHYFIPRRSNERAVIKDFVLRPLMVEVCRRFLGDSAFVFTELFICKEPHCKAPFGWHQDTGYVHAFGFNQYAPNITVWTALDDMTRDNGALWVKAFSSGGSREVIPHHPDEWGNQVAEFESGTEQLLEVPRGSLIVMTGTLPHKSDPNRTDSRRRAHLTQYGSEAILVDGQPIQLALPVLRDGQDVSRSA